MKKLLYVVMAALVLVACNPNEPKVVNKDKKMLDKGTKELLSLLGQKEKTVIKAFEEAGFVDEEDLKVPARFRQHAALDIAPDMNHSVSFIYNAPENFDEVIGTDADEDEQEEFFNAIAASKKVLLEVTVFFDTNNKCSGFLAATFAGQEVENINYLYLNCSRNIFDSMESLDAEDYDWTAKIFEDENRNAGKDYAGVKKRDKFDEKAAAEEELYTQEAAEINLGEKVINYSMDYYFDGNRIAEGTVFPKGTDPLVYCLFVAFIADTEATPEP